MTNASSSRRFGVNAKLFVFFIITLTVVVAVFVGVNYTLQLQTLENGEARDLSLLTGDFATQLEDQQTQAAALGASLAIRPDLRQALIERDRTLLLTLLQPIYLSLRDDYGVNLLNIIEADGTIFLRLQALGRSGDSAAFRGLVADAMSRRETVAGLDVGATAISNRAVVPILESGSLLGFVEVGFDVGATLTSQLKEQTGATYQLWLNTATVQQFGFVPTSAPVVSPNPDFFFYVGTNTETFGLPASDFSLETATTRYVNDAAGSPWAVQIAPVRGYSRPLGVLVVALSRTKTLAAINNALLVQAVLGGVLLVVGVAGVVLTSQRVVLRPLSILTAVTRQQLGGNLNAQVTGLPNDEFGELGSALNTLSQQLDSQLRNQDRLIAERTLQLETTFAISRRLSTILDPHTLVLNVVEQLREAFGYYHVHIYLFDEAREYLVMTGGTGEVGQQLLARNHRVPRDRGLVGRAARTNLMVHVPNTRQDTTWLPNPLLPDTQAEIAVPVSVGDDVLGVLDVQQNTPNAFSESDIEVLQAIANQMAVGLQNARSYEVTRRRAEREAALNELTRKIQATTSLEGALKVTAHELGQTLRANRVGVHLNPSAAVANPSHRETSS